MVHSGLSDVGEEYITRVAWRDDSIAKPSFLTVLLYEDNIDTLEDHDDIGAITSEPEGGQYERESVNIDSEDFTIAQSVDDRVRSEFSVTFGVRNTSGAVDAWAGIVNFQSDVVYSEASANDHLLTSATLDQGSISLAANDEITVSGAIVQE